MAPVNDGGIVAPARSFMQQMNVRDPRSSKPRLCGFGGNHPTQRATGDRLITLGARATYMFDITEIMAGAGPDLEGNVIPPGAQEGSVEIVGEEADNQTILLAVDSSIYNVRKATCYTQCTTCNGTTSYGVAASPFSVGVGSSVGEYLQAQWNTGTQYDYTSSSNWSSSSPGIATVPSPGQVQGVAPGSVTVTAGISGVPVYANTCNPYPICPILGGGGGQAPGTTLQVTISMRNSGTVSSDDAGATAYKSETGSTSLGPYAKCYEGVELVGAVSPSTYTGAVTLHRRIVSFGCYLGSTTENCGITAGQDDTSNSMLLDTDPQSGGSAGKVYDLDAPGVTGSMVPYNSTRRLRVNFQEYATDAAGNAVSSAFNYFIRVSCTADPSGNVSWANDVANDNQLGSGTTNTSWNLQ